MKQLEALLNLIIRIVIGLFGLSIIVVMFMIWFGMFEGSKSDDKPEIGFIIFGVFGGLFFIKYAIKGNKMKTPNEIKDLIIIACKQGDFEYLKSALSHSWGVSMGYDLNNIDDLNHKTPLDYAIENNYNEIISLLRKHGGKTGEELKAEGK